jgi:hypothetical protein
MIEGVANNPRCINCRGETRCIRCGTVKKDSEFCRGGLVCSECQPPQQRKYALDGAAAVTTFSTTSSDIDLGEYLRGRQDAIAEQLQTAISTHR